MTVNQVIGNRADRVQIRISNKEATATIPYGAPVVFDFGGTADLKIDGRNVVLPSTALVANLGKVAGICAITNGVPQGQLGNAQVYGVISIPVIANTRADLVTAYGAKAAVTAPTGLTVDWTNNFLTALTVVAPTTSNFIPFLLIDTIAANQGTGTTPAAGLIITVNVRVLVKMGV